MCTRTISNVYLNGFFVAFVLTYYIDLLIASKTLFKAFKSFTFPGKIIHFCLCLFSQVPV